MLTSTLHKQYTDGNAFGLGDVLSELKELFEALLRLDKKSIIDELGDISANFQLLLYTKLRIDTSLWKPSMLIYKKLHKRRSLWNKIYKYVVLQENTTNYCGNCERIEKVINHLKRYSISERRAKQAYNTFIKSLSKKY